jgi:hypothetical protein
MPDERKQQSLDIHITGSVDSSLARALGVTEAQLAKLKDAVRLGAAEYVRLENNSFGHNTGGVVCHWCGQSSSYYYDRGGAIWEWNARQRGITQNLGLRLQRA